VLGLGRRTEEVLVLVKAYPNPSSRYGESACIAGVTRDNEWIRLYPVDFRHLPADRRLRKWQWIRVRVAKSRRDQLTQERDLHLLLGAPLQQHRFGSFLVVGVFYPPRGGTQMVMFDR